jgi:radical SAM superfamily enzyme YgiQ (UPF0313 family)
MRILVGQSYFRVLDPKELRRAMPYPPLGTLYAATVLKQAGHEVRVFDGMLANDTAEFYSTMDRWVPDCVLLYDDEFNYLTKMCLSNMRDAAFGMIRYVKSKGLPIVVYSSDATDHSVLYLDAGADAVVIGEGEHTVRELMGLIESGSVRQQRASLAGLRYVENGQVVDTGRREIMKDLDLLPNPDFSLVAVEEYRSIWRRRHGYFSLNLSTTRGCPFHCNWCAKPIYGQVYHSRSPNSVSAEISELKDRYAVDHLWITDDIFALRPGWLEGFAEECSRRTVKVPYKCLTRADLLLRGDMTRMLRETGCETVWIGAESGSQRILDAMEKGIRVEQIHRATSEARAAGMKVCYFIQFGYTGETWEDIRATRKLIRDCLPDDIGVSVSYPLPGTRFFERVKRDLGPKTNWTDSDDLDLMFPGPYPRTFYRILHRLVHAEFRLAHTLKGARPRRIIRFSVNLLRYLTARVRLSFYLVRKRRPGAFAGDVRTHLI